MIKVNEDIQKMIEFNIKNPLGPKFGSYIEGTIDNLVRYPRESREQQNIVASELWINVLIF